MFNFLRRRTAHNNHLFNAQYIDPKALFVYYFNALPNVSYITEVDVSKAYSFIRDTVGHEADDCFQHAQYNRDTGKMEFNVTFIVLRCNRIIEVGGDYVAILHGRNEAAWAGDLIQKIAAYRVKTTSNGRIGFATGQEINN